MAIILAVGLGVAAGLALGSRVPSSSEAPIQLASAPPIDPEALAGVEALRDEAEALTAAEIELDETLHERWMPRVAKIEQALDDPTTPEPIRRELESTIAALECVGVLAASGEPTCVTLRHR